MKTKQLVAELISAGCVILRYGKRHDIWLNPVTGGFTEVPRHESAELPKGTECTIRKKLSVPQKR